QIKDGVCHATCESPRCRRRPQCVDEVVLACTSTSMKGFWVRGGVQGKQNPRWHKILSRILGLLCKLFSALAKHRRRFASLCLTAHLGECGRVARPRCWLAQFLSQNGCRCLNRIPLPPLRRITRRCDSGAGLPWRAWPSRFSSCSVLGPCSISRKPGVKSLRATRG